MSKKLFSKFVCINCFLFASITITHAQSDDYIVHIIKHGEVPSVLAKKYNVSLVELASLNKWGPKVILHVGDKIKLPAGAHLVQPVDSVATAPTVANTPKDELSGKPASVQSVAITPALQVPDTTKRVILHIIKHGEVPSVLAKKYNISLDELSSLNNWGPKKTVLHVGDKIKLPATARTTESSDSIKVVPPHFSPLSKQPATAGNDEQLAGRSAPDQTHLPAPAEINFSLHVVEKGEIPSVLAKKYNVNVDDLKKLNNWKPGVIWHVGDKVKLPPGAHLTEAAPVVNTPVVPHTAPVVAATTANPALEKGIEGTYIVQPKETLYSIGKKYKIPVVKIKNWNHLVDDHISVGQALILYTQNPIVQSLPGVKTDTVATTVVKNIAPVQPANVISSPTTITPSATPNLPKAAADTASANPQGYFTSLFGLNVSGRTMQTADGMAMTFKTASGWSDKKYYVLMNDVQPGSIVKVSNADGKSVYAKVLWNMGDAKDNEGLNFRISDAAAAALGLKDTKFTVSVTYYK